MSLSAVSGKPVLVSYSAANGTATGSGTDFTLASATLTIAAGSTTGTISPTIINDSLDEENETFVVTLASPSNATLGSTTTHTYTITDNDDPPTVAFSLSTSSGLESSTSANLTVSLSVVSGKDVSISYSVSGGTATGSGTDYTLASGSKTITAGNTSTTISITVVDDSLDEDNETIIVALASPTNASLGSTTTHTYTITDNDDPPTVTLSSSTTSLEEGGTSASRQLFELIRSAWAAGAKSATLTATLSAASGKEITITLASSGTATLNSDYTISPTSISITAGKTSNTSTVTVTDDSTVESLETIVVDISSVTNGTEKGTQQLTLSITDNDDDEEENDDEPAPVADAGADSTMVTGKSITLDGTGSTGTELSYQWSASLGTLTDNTSSTPTYTAPSVAVTEATSDEITLTVTDDQQRTASDTVLIYIIPSMPQTEKTLEDKLVWSKGKTTLFEEKTDKGLVLVVETASGTTSEIVLPSEANTSSSKDPPYVIDMTDESLLVISVPQASDGNGAVYVAKETVGDLGSADLSADIPTLPAVTKEAEQEESLDDLVHYSVSTDESFDVITGNTPDSGFGRFIRVADVNGDGNTEIIVGANDLIYVFNSNLDLVSLVRGSEDYLVSSVLVDEIGSLSMIFGPNNLTTNANLTLTDLSHVIAVDEVFTVDGTSIDSLATIDLSLVNPDILVGTQGSYGSYTTGDLNSDTIMDLVLSPSPGSASTTAATVYFGPFPSDTSLSTMDVNVTIGGVLADENAGYSLAVCDATGDGNDDLIIGAPDSGTVYAVFGPLSSSLVTLGTDANTIATTSTEGMLGYDLLCVNADGNNEIDEIYTLDEEGLVHQIALAETLDPLTEDLPEEDDNDKGIGLQGGGSGLISCQLYPFLFLQNHFDFWLVFMLLIFSQGGLLVYRFWLKKGSNN